MIIAEIFIRVVPVGNEQIETVGSSHVRRCGHALPCMVNVLWFRVVEIGRRRSRRVLSGGCGSD